jgi:hypothetical protein
MRALALPILAASLLSLPAQALSLRRCTEPTEPYCLSLSSEFRSQYDFSSCRSSVESFRSEAQSYRECLRRNDREVVEEVNRVVRKFNCMASRESFCP